MVNIIKEEIILDESLKSLAEKNKLKDNAINELKE